MPEKRVFELEEAAPIVKSSKLNKENDCKPVQQEDEMGEFEDVWEDDMEEDGEVIVHPDSDEDEGMQLDPENLPKLQEEEEEDESKLQVYLPGETLQEGEVLVPDNSAYELLHTMGVEWPCLSFDILKDQLGASRTKLPATTYIVAGSQAEKPVDNKLYIMKMSQLHRTKFDDDDEMEDDEDEDLDEDPILEYKTIPHYCGVNRVRVMPHPESHIVSTWSEAGKVHIWDITQHVQSLDTPGMMPPSEPQPIYNVDKHKRVEGYGMDWSSTVTGHLVTGDCQGKIYLTMMKNNSGFMTDDTPFMGHKGSVEDLQWSPSERNVFASCGVDGTVKIWDVRQKKPALSVLAHQMDVNVITWNRSMSYLLASGSDSGEFSVWDLRTWSAGSSKTTPSTPTPAASFTWHKKPITSIQWHPHDSSMLAVSGEDDQITLWDLALEADTEEKQKEEQVITGPDGQQITIPPQLLFIHQGQTHIKELHFHKQIPGMIISTSLDGFHLFKTINS